MTKNNIQNHFAFFRFSIFPVKTLFVVSIILAGCIPSTSTPTESIYPTSMAHCLPDSVFTAEDMRARVGCHPDNYKLEITKVTSYLTL
jgi:hypothetical protein